MEEYKKGRMLGSGDCCRSQVFKSNTSFEENVCDSKANDIAARMRLRGEQPTVENPLKCDRRYLWEGRGMSFTVSNSSPNGSTRKS